MGKILLFYKYVPLEYPKRILKWQQQVCSDLGLKGRILLGEEGINGTVGGSEENTERYKAIMKKNPLFADIDFKESTGSEEDFPRMQITVKPEIVHLGLDTQEFSVQDNATHLEPSETHELINCAPEDLVLFDARNNFESEIGTFQGAITPDIETFREFPNYVDEHKDLFENKQVLMFCTGGIRCERASAYVKKKTGAKKVYQMNGGIHRYVEQYPNGYFRGKNYVFDKRIAVRVTEDVLGHCFICKNSADDYTNCMNAQCNKHFIACKSCFVAYDSTCSDQCKTLVSEKKVPLRAEQLSSHDKTTRMS